MSDIELKILRLHAPLLYRSATTANRESRPFPERADPPEGYEEVVLYEADSVVRQDPSEGPRARPFPESPRAAGAGPSAVGPGPGSTDQGGPDAVRLEAGAYGFLQGRAGPPEDWRELLEAFARQAWWEGVECSGPYILRRVREDGRWAAQVWRRLAGDGVATEPEA